MIELFFSRTVAMAIKLWIPCKRDHIDAQENIWLHKYSDFNLFDISVQIPQIRVMYVVYKDHLKNIRTDDNNFRKQSFLLYFPSVGKQNNMQSRIWDTHIMRLTNTVSLIWPCWKYGAIIFMLSIDWSGSLFNSNNKLPSSRSWDL